MAELADAQVLGTCSRKRLGVQVLSPAQFWYTFSMKFSRLLFYSLFTFLFISIIYSINKHQTQIIQPAALISPTPQNVLGESIHKQTKFTNCLLEQNLPDKDCTPGQVFDEVTKEQICVPGYSKSVRNVPEKEKNEVYTEYNITSHVTGEYEVDHLISLELGGSNDLANLWPEPAEPSPGFHEKDKVENYLHKQVCSGQISLTDSQIKIATNWKEFLPFINN